MLIAGIVSSSGIRSTGADRGYCRELFELRECAHSPERVGGVKTGREFGKFIVYTGSVSVVVFKAESKTVHYTFLKVFLPVPWYPLSPSKPPHCNPGPTFTCWMQNHITTSLFCLSCCYKKSTYLLQMLICNNKFTLLKISCHLNVEKLYLVIESFLPLSQKYALEAITLITLDTR